jgi:hypothetical protein
MVRVHSELAANRAAANRKYGVFCVRKNGELYKQPSVTASSQDEANRACDRMNEQNPGSTFVVKAL